MNQSIDQIRKHDEYHSVFRVINWYVLLQIQVDLDVNYF
jgi:hypothetical protein